MPTSFVCEHCHLEFIDQDGRKSRRFCSRECERAFRRAKMQTIQCAQCGKEFMPTNRTRQKYCSKPCQVMGIRKPGSNNNTFICATCGCTFIDTGWAKERKYCSMACASIPLRIRVKVTCLHCGTVSERQKGWAKQANVHFCNRECRNAYQSGPTHPKWRGGAIEWRGSDWLRQSAAARKRDGYRCQRCGITQAETGQTLDVHHIVPFRAFGVKRHKEANELSNLVSLCRHCHAQVEWHNAPLQLSLLRQ